MIKKLIIHSNLNMKNMLKYGTIATVSMITIIFSFGIENGMLAFPIALTAISLAFEDIHVKTLRKTIKLLFFNTSIVTLAYLASLNPYTGVLINFITVFLIAYFLTARFNPKIYKPFMMLFVFTSFSPTDFPDFITRIESIIFGVLFVIILTFITSRKTYKSLIKEDIYMPFSILSQNLDSLLKGEDFKKGYKSFSKSMRALCYKIYVTRYRNYLVTHIGKIEFDLFLSLERLNIHLNNLASKKDLKNNKTILYLKHAIDHSLEILKTSNNIDEVIFSLRSFVSLNSNEDEFKTLIEIIHCLSASIYRLTKLKASEINKPYESWHIPKIKSPFSFNREHLTFNSIKVRFALRISIALTLTVFLGHIISLYKFIWVAITIMSVMQPYYEETLSKAKERIIGNLIGVTTIITLLHITKDPNVAIAALIVALYFTYGFKEYYKLSIFTSIASISMASLTTGLTEITISRISFIGIGILVVFLFNKFVFPYNIQSGIKTLTGKLLKYNTTLLTEYINFKEKKPNFDSIAFRDLIILTTLNAEKLVLRNSILNSKYIDDIVELNNNFTINLAFNTLIKDI
ncbi:MAG: FUSC family protein [Clostridium sp.]|uniref:FUSC family protein n=1 Tax=Clostridium sp. TaxID=1506 RepID=UPI003EE81E41